MWQIETMTAWPYPETSGRRYNPFRAPFATTLTQLESELVHLQVRGAVAVRVVADEADVRRDGMLRAKARTRHPGVALSFTSASLGALTYPCDGFVSRGYSDTADWQVNLRAITLGLQHLRALDRYGIAARGEQYAGWRAIEAHAPAWFGSTDEAIHWLAEYTGLSRHHVEPKAMLRSASLRAHPDTGGDRGDWERVDAARQLLQKSGVVS